MYVCHCTPAEGVKKTSTAESFNEIKEHTPGFIVKAKNLLLSGQLFAALISHPLPSNHTYMILMDACNNNGYLEQLIY